MGELSSAWDFMTPSGGVLMTVALRAMIAELDDAALRPIAANALFLSPVPSGRLEVRVEVLRRGGAAAQLRAALSSTDHPGPGLEVSATFGRYRGGPEYVDAEMPDVPLPDVAEVVTPRPVPGGFIPPFVHNYDIAHAAGPRFWADDWAAGLALSGRWFRHRVPQFLDDGRLDPLVIPPIADNMVPAVIARLGPDRDFYAPSLDLTVHFLADTTAQWLLPLCTSRVARGGYATADCEIWTDTGDLVAFSTQTMILRRTLTPPA